MRSKMFVFYFSVESKSFVIEKANQTLAAEVTEEIEKRPFSSSTGQFSEVSQQINLI